MLERQFEIIKGIVAHLDSAFEIVNELKPYSLVDTKLSFQLTHNDVVRQMYLSAHSRDLF